MINNYTKTNEFISNAIKNVKQMQVKNAEIRTSIQDCSNNLNYIYGLLTELKDECDCFNHCVVTNSIQYVGDKQILFGITEKIKACQNSGRLNKYGFVSFSSTLLNKLDEGFDTLEMLDKFEQSVQSIINLTLQLNEDVVREGSNLFTQLQLEKEKTKQ